MRVLITGSNGALGTYLSEHFDDLSCISRPQCDLNDFESTYKRIRIYNPEIIYHLASDANVREAFDRPQEVFSNNTIGTINLFEAVRKSKINPLIVVASSSEVYGNPKTFPINEDFPISPSNPYAASKAAQDLLAQMYGKDYGMRVVITRGFSYVNPLRGDLALSNFARQIVAIEQGKQTVIKHGNLDSVRAWCDVRDIVKAYVLATTEGIYNIGGSETASIGECLEILKSLSTAKIQCVEDPALMRPTDVTNQIPDCSKFMSLTGWKPVIALKDSLKWLLDCYR